MAGVPTVGLVLVLVLSVVFLYVLRLYVIAIPIALLYLIMRQLTARDPWLIEIVLDNITQKDVFIP